VPLSPSQALPRGCFRWPLLGVGQVAEILRCSPLHFFVQGLAITPTMSYAFGNRSNSYGRGAPGAGWYLLNRPATLRGERLLDEHRAPAHQTVPAPPLASSVSPPLTCLRLNADLQPPRNEGPECTRSLPGKIYRLTRLWGPHGQEFISAGTRRLGRFWHSRGRREPPCWEGCRAGWTQGRGGGRNVREDCGAHSHNLLSNI